MDRQYGKRYYRDMPRAVRLRRMARKTKIEAEPGRTTIPHRSMWHLTTAVRRSARPHATGVGRSRPPSRIGGKGASSRGDGRPRGVARVGTRGDPRLRSRTPDDEGESVTRALRSALEDGAANEPVADSSLVACRGVWIARLVGVDRGLADLFPLRFGF